MALSERLERAEQDAARLIGGDLGVVLLRYHGARAFRTFLRYLRLAPAGLHWTRLAGLLVGYNSLGVQDALLAAAEIVDVASREKWLKPYYRCLLPDERHPLLKNFAPLP